MTRSEQDKKARERIMYIGLTLKLIPAIKETVAQFDGKIFNVRLERALKEISNREPLIFISSCEERKYLDVYFDSYNDFTLVNIIDLLNGKRINATAINSKIDEVSAALREEAEMLSRAVDGEVDAVLEEIERIKAEWRRLQNSIPTRVKDIWEIDSRILY